MKPTVYQFTPWVQRLLVLLVLSTLGGAGHAQMIRYVKATATGTGDGTSWANASGDLQSQIDIAGAQQVWVAGGAYYPGTSRGSSFSLKSGVAVYGGFNSTNPESSTASRSSINPVLGTPSSTTLSGDIGTRGVITDNSYTILNNNNVASTARLDGFVISGAYNTNFSNFSIGGAGVVNSQGGATFVNCQISQNTLTANAFGAGAGMTNLESSPTLISCVISGNVANSTFGGGIYNNTSNPILTSCIISSNTATGGGGFYNVDSSPILTNCLLTQNVSGQDGGAIRSDRGSLRLTNCTIAGNQAATGVALSGGSVTMNNCILWDNQGNNAITGTNPTANYCLIEFAETDYTGTGNIKATASPFTTGSYQLSGCSTALNAGNNAAYNSAQGPGTDLVGNTRLYQGGIIDLGAYEFQGTPSSSVAITQPPLSGSSVTAGASVSVPVSVSGTVSNYQWYKDNLTSPVTGQTSATLTLTNVQVSNAGSYSLVVTGVCNSVTSTAFSLSVSVPAQPIRYVKAGGSGTGDGTSWTNASGDLQSQIDIAGAQQVWVAGGLYTTTSNGGSFSLKNGVAVYGGFAGGEQTLTDRPGVNPVGGAPSSTTLTSGGSVVSNFGLDNTARLDGVVITGGNSVRAGGGIYNNQSSPVLANCTISGNTATDQGGGIYNSDSSNPLLTNCVLTSNTAINQGGGIYNINSSPVLTNCLINGNTAFNYGQGGGIYNNGSNLVLDNCTISGNTATEQGGGIYNINSSPVLTNCSISGNTASSTGGGIYNFSSSPVLTNCLLANNTATDQGGGICNVLSNNSKLVNCTLTGNSAGDRGGAIYESSATSQLTNVILWNNGGTNAFRFLNGGSTTLTYSLIESGATGYTSSPTNLTATVSPFVSGTNYQLAPCSVAINAGDPTSTSATSGTTDLAGNPRFFQGGRIDMGAYEFQGTPNSPVAITQQPLSGSSVTAGASVSVPVSVSGTVSNYQWYKDNLTSPVTGQTSATLTLTNVQVSDAGSYSLVVTGVCNSVTSTAFSLSVSNPTPTIAGFAANPSPVCVGNPLTLTATIGNVSGNYSFTLSNGPDPLTGTSSNSTFNRTITASGAGNQTYTLTVQGSNGQRTTATTNLTVNTLPTPTLSAAPSTTLTCAQTSLTLTAGGGDRYAFSGPGVVSQSGNQAVVNQAGSYSVTVTNGSTGCSSTTVIPISQDVSMPMASLVSSGTLTCSLTGVTLTASPSEQRYHFSAGATQIGTGNQATVSSSGLYSVTVTYGNGCSSVAYTSVSQDNAVPAVSISAIPSLTIAPGQSATLTAQVSGGTAPFTYAWSTGSTASAIVASTGGPYSVTATGANGCAGTASTTVTVSGPFAITGVTTLSCDPILPNRFSLSFNPRYQGQDGSPVSFSVTNELFPTTSPGPYTLQLYSDNPTIVLNAVQGGVSSSFVYHWLAACNSSTTPNTPPRVQMGIPAQTATQGSYFSYVIPNGTFTDEQTPGSLRLSATGLPAGLSFVGATLSGTPSTTVGSPFSITITATDPGNLSASTTLLLSVQPATGTPPPTAPFAITGVTTISCTPVANRINIVFSPRYQGMSGQPVAFEVVNELAPTTDPAPYSLTLYRDNPTITLRATQTGSPGPVTYAYDWLVACSSLGQENTPPKLNQPVAPQSATVGVGYSLNLTNTFIDQETPNQITLFTSALPAGLTLTGKTLSGTPSMSGVTSVTLTARDGGGLSTSTRFTITVQPGVAIPPPTGPFSITGVTTLSCEVSSAGERRLSFTPQYGGDQGSPISFSVVSELSPTTNPGPYTLRLYTDNPVITLSAVQGGMSSQFRYHWLAACTASARVGTVEEIPLSVRVLGNPVVGESVEIEVRGAQGQPLILSLVDERGQAVSSGQVPIAGAVETLTLAVGRGAGVYLLQVGTPTQQRSLKLLKH